METSSPSPLPPPDETISSLRTRPSLLQRIHTWDDDASWHEFYRLYRKLIYGLARRAGLGHADAEEVTQDVFRRVAETIHDFESDPARGTFRGWLMNLTRWRIANKFQARPRIAAADNPSREHSSTRTPTIERIADPAADDGAWDREWQQHLIDAASERILRKVKGRHFQAFDLYVRQQWPVLKVARELGMNPATVYIIGFRLTRQLKVEVERLKQQLG